MLLSQIAHSIVALLYFLLNFIAIQFDNSLSVWHERFGIFKAIAKHF
jgi:hypothetical protein